MCGVQNCVFFDIDTIADTETTSLPHMLPSEDQFSEALSSLGISQGDFVVVYDSAGLLSAPRAWWTFKALGMDDVGVLDGGLPEWQRLGFDMVVPHPLVGRRASHNEIVSNMALLLLLRSGGRRASYPSPYIEPSQSRAEKKLGRKRRSSP